MIYALIPARSGSKRVPNKNIRMLGGKPLLAYSIEVALACESIDKVIVSTDSDEYADIAKQYGAEVLMRRGIASSDTSTDMEVVQHFLSSYNTDKIVYLRPTTPLRKVNHLYRAIGLANGNTGLRSVEHMAESAWKSLTISCDLLWAIGGNHVDIAGEPNNYYQKTYKGNGYVDIIFSETVENGSLFGNKVYPFVTEPVVEVDTEFEFKLLEMQLQMNGGKHVY